MGYMPAASFFALCAHSVLTVFIKTHFFGATIFLCSSVILSKTEELYKGMPKPCKKMKAIKGRQGKHIKDKQKQINTFG